MKQILTFICLILSVTTLAQDKSLALVIGNSSYEQGEALKYAVSDAYLISFTLEDLGFDVISITNASKSKMDETIAKFWEQLVGYDVALIYYAGHGMQLNGLNYLIPVDAKLKRPDDLKKEAVEANRLVAHFGQRSPGTNIAILDASGKNSFRPWVKEGEEGFASMTAPEGSIISLATSPGTITSEGTGSNSLYIESLTRQMMIPQPIGKVFSNTRLLVSHASKGKQNPVEWSSIDESYSLLAGAPQKMKSTGSIVITSQIAGNLYIEDIEMASVEPNSVVPLNNMEAGSYNLKISGEESWEEVVLVLENQITNVSADGTPADPGNIMVDNRDMYKYTIKVFGSKTWMTANASYEVPVESYCYDNDAANCDVLGRLYTWEAAQNVCPDGWHLPSDVEWMALEKFIGMKEKETMKMGLRGVSAGNLLKDNTLNLWTSPEEANSRTNGFNALPGGYSLNKTTFLGIDKSAIFWTSTEQRGSSAYYRKIEDSKGGIHRYYSEKSTAYAVRCVKD